MKFQTLGLQKIVGDKATWDFLDGGREWRSKTPPSEMMLALAQGQPLRGWYAVADDGGDERPFAEKLFDDSVLFNYEEVDAAVDRVLAHMHERGPFDVVVGFSQGCIMTHLLAAVLRDRDEPIPWRLSVQFCGMRVRDDRYARLFEEALMLPVVQVYGKSDELYAYGRQSQPELYKAPVILEHEEGHKFPTQRPRSTEIYERVLEEMLRHCADPVPAN
jgi:predicted esterase